MWRRKARASSGVAVPLTWTGQGLSPSQVFESFFTVVKVLHLLGVSLYDPCPTPDPRASHTCAFCRHEETNIMDSCARPSGMYTAQRSPLLQISALQSNVSRALPQMRATPPTHRPAGPSLGPCSLGSHPLGSHALAPHTLVPRILGLHALGPRTRSRSLGACGKSSCSRTLSCALHDSP